MASRTQHDLNELKNRHSDVFKTYSASFLSTNDVSAAAPSRNNGSEVGTDGIDGEKDIDFLRDHAQIEDVSQGDNAAQKISSDDNPWKGSQG